MVITDKLKKVVMTTDASGAVSAAQQGLAVMIVDVIDMSTTLESALDAGAVKVFGASPDFTRAPVKVDPERIGRIAARTALTEGVGVIVVSEPRTGGDEERLQRCQKLMEGLNSEGVIIEAVVPNLGAETPLLTHFENRVVVAVTDTGGVAFDAAYQVTDQVITGTIARTLRQKGTAPATTAALRALTLMEHAPGIAVVAASRNSQEDILAARYILELIKELAGTRDMVCEDLTNSAGSTRDTR
ncbi:MAG: hypothetical protein ACOX3D_05965 [Syntrophomonadales bacterium]